MGYWNVCRIGHVTNHALQRDGDGAAATVTPRFIPSLASFDRTMSHRNISYSDKYYDEEFEYRYVWLEFALHSL